MANDGHTVTCVERVDDLATNLILDLINSLRILGLLVQIAAEEFNDGFVINLAETGERGIPSTGTGGST
jgi:hypothetical protein